jgi:hypothetical protein
MPQEEEAKTKYIALRILSKILNALVTILTYITKLVDGFMFLIGKPFEALMNGVGGVAPLSYVYLVALGFLVACLYGIIQWVINQIFSGTLSKSGCALSHTVFVTSIVSWLVLLWLFAVFAR